MSRKKIIIIIGIILIIGIGVFFFLRNKSGTGGTISPGTPADYFPFGQNGGNVGQNSSGQPNDQQTDTTNTAPVGLTIPQVPKLRLIARGPIAGFTVIQKNMPIEIPTTTVTNQESEIIQSAAPTRTITTARYVEAATGHIVDVDAFSLASTKVSNATVPGIHEALFAGNGDTVFLRFLDSDNQTIRTFGGIITPPNTSQNVEGSLDGTFLYQNIRDMSVSPDTQNIFYLLDANNQIVGSTVDSLGQNVSNVFSSPYTEWLPQFISPQTVALTTKASAASPGYLYNLTLATKGLKKILGDIAGLTTNESNDGYWVLYSSGINNGISPLTLYNTVNQSSFNVQLSTLPEKCVWGAQSSAFYCAVPKVIPAGSYPDVWYQGVQSFNDYLYKTVTGVNLNNILLEDLSYTSNEAIDAINLTLSPNERYLFFTNKRDGSLWEYRL